jgi:hypothetical protein
MPVCCSGASNASAVGSGSEIPTRAWGGARRLARWALPVTVLALIPKCPACFAGYVLLFTGVGLSMSVAATARWIIVLLCVVALALLAMRGVWRVLQRPRGT